MAMTENQIQAAARQVIAKAKEECCDEWERMSASAQLGAILSVVLSNFEEWSDPKLTKSILREAWLELGNAALKGVGRAQSFRLES